MERLIDQPDSTVDDLCEIVTGPDFPTGGTVFRFADQRSIAGEKERIDAIRHMYATGRGRVIMRGQVALEESARTDGGRDHRAAVPGQQDDPHREDGGPGRREEADRCQRHSRRIRPRRDADRGRGQARRFAAHRDAQLFKHTALESSFSTNMLALVDGQPQTLGLKRMLEQYIAYRQDVIRRRTEFDLAKAQERAHILEGLKIALDHLDQVIATIRRAADADAAREALIKQFKLSEAQANAILEMQLRRLAALERKKIEDEYEEVIRLIAQLEDLLANPEDPPGHQGRARGAAAEVRRGAPDADLGGRHSRALGGRTSSQPRTWW